MSPKKTAATVVCATNPAAQAKQPPPVGTGSQAALRTTVVGSDPFPGGLNLPQLTSINSARLTSKKCAMMP